MEANIVYKDKYGRFDLFKKQNYIEAHIEGACNMTLINALQDGLVELAAAFIDMPWGYVSLSPNVDAATQDGEDAILAMMLALMKKGCVIDSYYLTSPLAIAQTKRVREGANITSDFNLVLFNSPQAARNFAESYLEKVSSK